MDIRNAFPVPVTPARFADLKKGDTVVHFAEGQAWVTTLKERGENTDEWWTNERAHHVFDKTAGEWGPATVSYSQQDDILAVAAWHGAEPGHSIFKAV